MMRISPGFVLSAVVAVSGLTTANAAFVSVGTYSQAVVRDCRSSAAAAAGSTIPDRCFEPLLFPRPLGTVVEFVQNVMPGSLTSSAIAAHPLATSGPNVTAGSATVQGDGLLRVGVSAFSGEPYARVSSTSGALASYYFDGSGPTVRTNWTHASFSALGLQAFDVFQAADSPAASFDVTLWIYSLPVSAFECVSPCDSSPFVGYAADAPGFRMEAAWQTDFTDEVRDFFLSYEMEAGRWYFTEFYASAFAKFGAWIDAGHTFTDELGVIDQNGHFIRSLEGLIPAAASIPEPGSIALAFGGLAAVFMFRLRRRLNVR